MARFEIINSRNSDFTNESSSEGKPSQLWGVIISEMTEIGGIWSFGVALSESKLITVVMPNDHAHLDRMKTHSEEIIGNLQSGV